MFSWQKLINYMIMDKKKIIFIFDFTDIDVDYIS